MAEDISQLREEYSGHTLTRDSLDPDPTAQFRKWFEEAQVCRLVEPNAMTLATVDAGGQPWQRTVLLKAYDKLGFCFFTNYESRKAQQIAGSNKVSLLFPWFALHRQVLILGSTEKIDASVSAKYFASRPLGSRLGAWASQQSSVVSSRSVLEVKLAEMERKFKDGDVPLPSFWGGYRVIPTTFEFWQGGERRLHDRFLYSNRSQKGWQIERLSP